MEKNEIDVKRLFALMLAVTLFMFGFELYTYYFSPKETPQKAAKREEVQSFPQLMLGSMRESKKPVQIQTFDFGNFTLSVSSEGGKIVSLVDKKYSYNLITDTEKKLNIYPLEVYTGNSNIDQKLNFSAYQIVREGNTIVMAYSDGDVSLTKRLTYEGDYFKLSISSKGLSSPLYVLVGGHPKGDEFYTHSGPVLSIGGKVERLDVGSIKGREFLSGDISFAGEESRYYFKGFVGKIPSVLIYKIGEDKDSLTLVEVSNPLIFYAGAKEYSRLKKIGLSDVIDYGTLKILVKPLFIFMYWIYEHLRSWVFSILALTLLVRVFMFPLTYKSTISMMKLSELAPKMQEIREKYKEDPTKMQEEMMKLYSQVGFNPMSGCLPMILQIPVFFALYKVLTITADLQLASMLWIPSLSHKDPYYILPIIMGLTMIAQQFISPNPDKTQNFMMYVSSVAFTFLFASFPAGLVLYWTFNNIFNMGQSYLIKEVLLKDRKKVKAEGKKKRK
ncbi:Membrane protein insertase YidC [bacterium HR13]|nr:Membrane protein insertase YidC [bacterium HR13]